MEWGPALTGPHGLSLPFRVFPTALTPRIWLGECGIGEFRPAKPSPLCGHPRNSRGLQS
jgi:hypothetical protein